MKRYSLAGVDGNAFSVMGYVEKAMRECRFSEERQAKYREEAMSSDYDHLLMVSMDMLVECNKYMEEGCGQ